MTRSPRTTGVRLPEHGLPSDVAGLLRHLDDAAGNHVFDQRRIERGTVQQFFQDGGVKVGGMNAFERASRAGAAAR